MDYSRTFWTYVNGMSKHINLLLFQMAYERMTGSCVHGAWLLAAILGDTASARCRRV